MALFFVGCTQQSGVNTPNNPTSYEETDNTEDQSAKEEAERLAKEEADNGIQNVIDVRWTRDTECDEVLCFLADGRFRYSCSCGNPVNDADVVESYSYDETTRIFTLHCYEEIEGMVTEITLVHCDGASLELDFDGEIRTFFN